MVVGRASGFVLHGAAPALRSLRALQRYTPRGAPHLRSAS
jgi:hypothetical protein